MDHTHMLATQFECVGVLNPPLLYSLLVLQYQENSSMTDSLHNYGHEGVNDKHVTPERLATVVASEGPKKQSLFINQVPRNQKA